jgi:hypothetical protein
VISAERRAYNQRYSAERYARLSLEHLCTKCGDKLDGRFKQCCGCRTAISVKRRDRAARKERGA